jgi:putative signal transducing protein
VRRSAACDPVLEARGFQIIERSTETMTAPNWREVATFSSGFEADFAVAQLQAAGIDAVRDDNDTVGIFGPGFQGTNPRGVTVRVPADALDEARAILRSAG